MIYDDNEDDKDDHYCDHQLLELLHLGVVRVEGQLVIFVLPLQLLAMCDQ